LYLIGIPLAKPGGTPQRTGHDKCGEDEGADEGEPDVEQAVGRRWAGPGQSPRSYRA